MLLFSKCLSLHIWLFFFFFFWLLADVCLCLIAQLCLTLCDPRDYRMPGSSVPGISQARILEWVAISFSRGSSQPRDELVSRCLLPCRQILYMLSHQGSQLAGGCYLMDPLNYHVILVWLIKSGFSRFTTFFSRMFSLPFFRIRKIPWRREWKPTPVFLLGKSHRQRSLVGYSPIGYQKVRHDWSNWTHTHN